MSENQLSLKNVTISFGGLRAVDDLSFDIKKGEIYGLIGPNGAGKTTVFNLISQFYKPSNGVVIFEGKNITKLKVHQVIGAGIARTFQNVELFKNLTVKENLLIGMHGSIKYGTIKSILRLPIVKKEEKRIQLRAKDILSLLGLSVYENNIASMLPYGVQKLVELGRALVASPKLIILDEPAAGMNETETKMISEKICEINEKQGVTILLVEHDMSLVMSICNRITVINFGKKIAEGTPEEIQNNPIVIKAYLGEEVS